MAGRIQELVGGLRHPGLEGVEVLESQRLSDALSLLSRDVFDAVLLNLEGPAGMDGIGHLLGVAPTTSVIVLVGDQEEAAQALRAGASDYLVREGLQAELLARVLRYAGEQHRLLERIQKVALVDELTGLFNRRGFFRVAEQHFTAARREGRAFLLIFADLDGLKGINDRLGHPEGDKVLVVAAKVLTGSVRDTDTVARLGGDEFVLLVPNAAQEALLPIQARIERNIEEYNSARTSDPPLSLSLGSAWFNPADPSSLEELMAQADRALYREKRRRGRMRSAPHQRGVDSLTAHP